MALVPRVVVASLPVPAGGRYAPQGPVAPVDPTPLVELGQQSMVTNGGATFRNENFSADNRFRRASDRAFDTPNPARGRENFSGLFVGSTLSFVDAFAMNAATAPRGGASLPSKSAVTIGVNSYETTAQVISNDLPARGQNLSLTL